jgi:hypothetical protein
MFNYDNFIYFLLLIDCFSLKIFTCPLKSKSSAVVGNALKEIFDKFNSPIHVLESDQGKEFIGCKPLFREQNIFYKSKFGRNKANFSEWGIYIIKKASSFHFIEFQHHNIKN